jgi:hypothetical protein
MTESMGIPAEVKDRLRQSASCDGHANTCDVHARTHGHAAATAVLLPEESECLWNVTNSENADSQPLASWGSVSLFETHSSETPFMPVDITKLRSLLVRRRYFGTLFKIERL